MSKDTYTVSPLMNAEELIYLMSNIMRAKREEEETPLATVIQFPTERRE